LRFTRIISFATWVGVALLSVYAFAAFTPEPADDESTAPTTVVALETEAGDTGVGAGRQAALALAQGLTGSDIAPLQIETTTTSSTSTTTSTTSTTTTVPPTTTTTAAPAPAPKPRASAPLPPASVRSLVEAYFAPQDVELAMVVAFCESRYDANATNRSSGAAGLFQHLPKFWADRTARAGWAGADIYDPQANVALAAWLVYSNGGWKHWNASRGCWSNTVLETTTTTTTLPPETTTTLPAETTTTLAPTTTTTVPPTTTTVPPTTTTTTTTTTAPPVTTTTVPETTTTLPAETTTTVPAETTTTLAVTTTTVA